MNDTPPFGDRGGPRGEWEQQRARFATQFAAHGESLTPLREAVLRQLFRSEHPVGAYELAARLSKEQGKTVAPNSVYRVLDVLMACKLVQRVESRHAFCLAPSDDGKGYMLLMCEDCGSVETVEAAGLDAAVSQQAIAAHFRPTRKVIEIAGICQSCTEPE
ncbi:MAG: transcriptional repressor [Erythrobacter sp.]|nr:transcriptional repressor [Erythrobacter sp.]